MGLQLEQDEKFNRRERTLQRVGWTAIGLIMLAGLVGLLGAGPLSSVSAASADATLRLEYDRFIHEMGDESLIVQLSPASLNGDTTRLAVSQEWIETAAIRAITPEPSDSISDGDRLIWEFTTVPGRELAVSISYRPMTIGPIFGEFSTGDQSVPVHQFAYP